MKQELLDLLEKNGYNKYFDELYADNVTVEDFVKSHPDIKKIPGAVDALQSKSLNAPHDLTEEEKDAYFFEDPESSTKYEAQESKLQKDVAEKQKLADEYKRSADDSYYNTMLANEYARKQHIKGNDELAALNEAAAKAAFATDFAPFPVSLIGPTIRYAQRAGNEDKWLPNAMLVADFGTSVLGPAKGAVKAGFEGVKNVAGPLVGRLFDSKLGKTIEKGLEAIDAKDVAKLAAVRNKAVMNKVDDFASKFGRGQYTEAQALDFAKSIDDDYPELANKLRDYVNTLATQRNAADKLAAAKQYKSKPADVAKREADDILSSKKLPEAKEQAGIELKAAQDDAAQAVYHNDVYLDAEGKLVFPVKDLKTQYDVFKAGKEGTALAKVAKAASKPAVKFGIVNSYQDNTDYTQYEKENDQALNFIIDKYKRQWDAGFVPRGDKREIIMQAFAKYLKDREGK